MTQETENARALWHREAKFHQFFDQHSAIMLLIDPQVPIIVDANQAAIEFYGYPLATLRGMKVEKINARPESEMQLQRELVLRGESNQLEVDHVLSNGEIRTVKVLTAPITIQDKSYLFSIIYDITKEKLLQQELENQARMDYLTGLCNRRYFMQQSESELIRAIRYGKKLSLFMMDIDRFKKINDDHGHQVGDLVLKKLARVSKEILREVDIVGRVGGEEFAILLPETGLDEAILVAERLRIAIQGSKVHMDRGLAVRFNVSIGITSLSSEKDNLDILISRADKALYEAKTTGRNKTKVAIN